MLARNRLGAIRSKLQRDTLDRAHYYSHIGSFLQASDEAVLGVLAAKSEFAVELPQRNAWMRELELLRGALVPFSRRGWLFLEFVLPRLGRRMDAIVVVDHVVFVIEFKVGQHEFLRSAVNQVWDYALDLKNFHEPSHAVPIVPILVATEAKPQPIRYREPASDGVFAPIVSAPESLSAVLETYVSATHGPLIDALTWQRGRYSPSPTIVEAARALYAGHAVEDVSRNDAGAANLSITSKYIDQVIADSQRHNRKTVCLLTGVPGAGKTLVGLDIATTHLDPTSELYSVFLSGNGPLVAVLREALARDQVRRETAAGRVLRKGDARRRVEAFIQNVHHFRDECLRTPETPPPEHVAIFDEAQRAWSRDQTAAFMKQKKGHANCNQSEPEFLLSCMDRHRDWAVVLCLIGGGQEINTGEAGIAEWIDTLRVSFPHWHVHLSPRLVDAEHGSGVALQGLSDHEGVTYAEALHLTASMRSFRAERVSEWVKVLLDRDENAARAMLPALLSRFPILVSRDLSQAKRWLRSQARGSERIGLVVSSQAQRLKPLAIDVRAPLDPVHWFLDDAEDVRSSYYLEDAATEFHVQGLELDWTCVVWDADFRFTDSDWGHWSFVGSQWQRIRKIERQTYQKNAYRVLLTRARQGMVIVVPEGDAGDRTRQPDFFDPTFAYLKQLGLPAVPSESLSPDD